MIFFHCGVLFKAYTNFKCSLHSKLFGILFMCCLPTEWGQLVEKMLFATFKVNVSWHQIMAVQDGVKVGSPYVRRRPETPSTCYVTPTRPRPQMSSLCSMLNQECR